MIFLLKVSSAFIQSISLLDRFLLIKKSRSVERQRKLPSDDRISPSSTRRFLHGRHANLISTVSRQRKLFFPLFVFVLSLRLMKNDNNVVLLFFPLISSFTLPS